jgi:Na+/H+ antiporter NhaA
VGWISRKNLASGRDEAMLNMAKLGTFTASLLAGVVGSALLRRKSPTRIQENQQE